jgi:hypothetical protein
MAGSLTDIPWSALPSKLQQLAYKGKRKHDPAPQAPARIFRQKKRPGKADRHLASSYHSKKRLITPNAPSDAGFSY